MNDVTFDEKQIQCMEDYICNKLLPRPMIMRNRWGIGQCGDCVETIMIMLETVRGFRHDDE